MSRRAFTVVELIAVIAIVGLLLAIILPGYGGAGVQVRRQQTQAQFARYTLGLQALAEAHGSLPALGSGGVFAINSDLTLFVEALTGRQLDGSPASDPEALALNPGRVGFCELPEGDFADGQLVDAFGNSNLVLLLDHDSDGLLGAAQLGSLPAHLRPAQLRASIALYSDNSSKNPDWEWVRSWQ